MSGDPFYDPVQSIVEGKRNDKELSPVQFIFRLILLILFLYFLSHVVGCSWFKGSDPAPAPTKPDLPTIAEYGQDWLALQHPSFNLGAALELIPVGTRIPVGMLANSFGDSMSPVDLALGSGKVSHIRIHLGLNGPGLRNSQLQPYEIGYGHTVQSFNEAVTNRDESILAPYRVWIGAFCVRMDQYSDVRFYMSPMLEHNLTVSAWNVLYDELRATCDRNDYYIVNNPENSHEFPSHPQAGVLFEAHHGTFDFAANINSLDGQDVSEVHIPTWKSNVANSSVGLAFNWGWMFNCRVPGPFIPPRSRTNCPTPLEHQAMMNIIFGDSPEPGQPYTVVESWGAGNLWKPVSESDGNPVVLIRNAYQTEFLECKSQRKSGAWDNFRCVKGPWNDFKCLSNPDRLTYRANYKCDAYRDPKTYCTLGNMTLILTGGSDPCKRHD